MKYIVITNSIYEGHPQDFHMGPFFIGKCETIEEAKTLIEKDFEEHQQYMAKLGPNPNHQLDWSEFERIVAAWKDPHKLWIEIIHPDKHPRSFGYIILNTEIR